MDESRLTPDEEAQLRLLFSSNQAGTLGKLSLTSFIVRLFGALDRERKKIELLVDAVNLHVDAPQIVSSVTLRSLADAICMELPIPKLPDDFTKPTSCTAFGLGLAYVLLDWMKGDDRTHGALGIAAEKYVREHTPLPVRAKAPTLYGIWQQTKKKWWTTDVPEAFTSEAAAEERLDNIDTTKESMEVAEIPRELLEAVVTWARRSTTE